MSYQGNSIQGNGYWPEDGMPYGVQGTSPQITANGVPAQYHYSMTVNPQYWDQHSHPQHAIPTAYLNNRMYSPAPVQQSDQQNFQPLQYLNPADLIQQQSTPRQQDLVQQPPLPRNVSTPSSGISARNGVAKHSGPEGDRPMLLVSLAEEFFDAATELAPTVAMNMTEENIEAYNELIATGLGCLDTALKNFRLTPRVEAKIRLRYAGVLFEETENFMEAETALSKGIVLCERNHYYDLKYGMQFLLAQFMCRKSPKASLKALDAYIADAQAYQHFSWVYAFRFLRASQALRCGAADAHSAIYTFRNIAGLASQQGDHCIFLVASLMEAMAHLKSAAPEAIEHVQTAIAAAYSYQLDASSRIPQLVGLTHLLDVACSIRQGNPAQMLTRLKALQDFIDAALEDPTWSRSSSVIVIPIGTANHRTTSPDTRAVLGVGTDGQENLILSFLSKNDAYAVNCLLFGAVLLHKNSADQKASKCLEQGLASLSSYRRGARAPSSTEILPDLLRTLQWRGELLCHFYLYLAFCEAVVGNWTTVKSRTDEMENTARDFNVSLSGSLGCLKTYLTAVYYQGTGNLDAALGLYQDEKFNLRLTGSTLQTSANQLERDVAVLATLNTLWILQEGHRQDPDKTAALLEKLTPLCTNHAIKDIETAFNMVFATVTVNPPMPGFTTKNFLRAALNRAQATANTQFLCITLSVMCDRYFVNIVGEQAVKSATAASVQAKKSGNILWRSVADGMLARCYEVQGNHAEARETMEQARKLAEASWPKT